jgi:hypothetical protein
MQSGWLRQYFVPQHNEQCQHTVELDTPGTASSEEGVSRRDFVTGGLVAGMAAGMIASDTVGGVRQAEAQTANPMGKDWWPSPWGADDEIGASQRITPAKVLEAAKLIKTGKIYRLGMNLEPGIPLFGQRSFSITIPGGPTGGPFGDQKLMYNDQYLRQNLHPGRASVVGLS